MQTPYFIALLAAGLVLGAVATPVPEQAPGPAKWPVIERSAQFAGTQPRHENQAELLPIVPAALITTVTGRALSCAEIRSIDEVELITDDSYCR